MQYLGKIKVKVSHGTGFGLLCLAAAGALTVKTCNMIADGVRAHEKHKMMKDLKEQSDTLHEMAEIIVESLKKQEEKKDAEVDDDVEEFLK